MTRLGSIERVGLAGFGAVGQRVALAIDDGSLGVTLAAITSGDLEKARAHAASLLQKPPPVTPLQEAVALSDLIVEAAPASAFPEIARTTLEGGKSLLVLSVGALLGHEQEYAELARQHGAIIHVASGAIGGLDAITSASAGRVDTVVMTTRVPTSMKGGTITRTPFSRTAGL